MMLFVTYFALQIFIIFGNPYDGYYGDFCSWDLYPSYHLDLTYFAKGDFFVEAQNVNYRYVYSPCNYSFYDTLSDDYYAIKRYNLDDSTVKYLVPLFTDPKKASNQDELTYQFTYTQTNKSCQDGIEIINVYWQCNNSIDTEPYYKIISAGSLFECQDTMFIQSPFGCTSGTIPKYTYDCSFSSNYTNIILNITELGTSYGTSYTYRACNNYLNGNRYKSNWGMIMYQLEPYSVLATWNESDIVSPIYDPIINVWSFTYYGYDTYVPPYYANCSVYKTTVIWGCNCVSTSVQRETIYTNDCEMTLNLTSKTLCINSINQCYPDKNNTDCIYYYRESENVPYRMLNLTALTDIQIGAMENGGLYGFIYTPCNNNLLCTDIENQLVMVGRMDINQEQCTEYLGIFNGTNSFIADNKGGGQWEITYFNGAQCPSDPDQSIQFKVYWSYSSSSGLYTIGSMSFVDCIYTVSISSKYVQIS